MRNSKLQLLLLVGLTLFSCKKQDDIIGVGEKSNDCSLKGVIAYCPSEERGMDELTASLDKENKTITFTTTALFSNETPVDLTNVIVELTLAKGASSDLKKSYDLDSKTDTITITAEDEETTDRWTLMAVRTDAKVLIPSAVQIEASSLWSKSAAELNLKSPLWGSRGMTCFKEGDKEYLYILDNVLPYSDDNKIRIYNANTSEYVSQISEYSDGGADLVPGCRSYMWDCDVDEAGHVVITRLNADCAGFFLDLYDNAAGAWKYISTPLAYVQETPGLTYYSGKKVQVLGNLLEGQGSVISTWGHFYGNYIIQAGYDVFPFVNGKSENIMAQSYPLEWWSGEIQQESLSNQTIYVMSVFENGYDPTLSEEDGKEFTASHLEIFDPDAGSVIELPETCFPYRVLASKVFNCGSGKYLYILGQGFTVTSPYVERLYYISDTELLKTISPDSPDWNKFLLWEQVNDVGGDSNGYRFGSVAVLPDNTTLSVKLYSYLASGDVEKAKVNATQVRFTEIF